MPQLDAGSSTPHRKTATVDLVVPVHNEERALPGCLQVLSEHLAEEFPFSWRTIAVVDSASTDGTLRGARELASSMDRVRVLHLQREGRGLALRTAWSSGRTPKGAAPSAPCCR